eukprot:364950-Chlamydomonas_euryale.AAC.17
MAKVMRPSAATAVRPSAASRVTVGSSASAVVGTARPHFPVWLPGGCSVPISRMRPSTLAIRALCTGVATVLRLRCPCVASPWATTVLRARCPCVASPWATAPRPVVHRAIRAGRVLLLLLQRLLRLWDKEAIGYRQFPGRACGCLPRSCVAGETDFADVVVGRRSPMLRRRLARQPLPFTRVRQGVARV